MRIIGIDPGKKGGVAVIDTVTGKASVYDIPIKKTTSGAKGHDDFLRKSMLRLLRKAAGKIWTDNVIVVIEEQHLFGREGRKSAFTLGVGWGQLLMAVDACELPYLAVNIAEWKHAMGLNSDKEYSRLRAIEWFPELANQLQLKKHHGRAEALLLACYYRDFILPGILKQNKGVA